MAYNELTTLIFCLNWTAQKTLSSLTAAITATIHLNRVLETKKVIIILWLLFSKFSFFFVCQINSILLCFIAI